MYGALRFLAESNRIPGVDFGQTGIPNQDFTLDDLLSSNQIYITTVAIRRQCLLNYGGFRLELRYREDYEPWLRLKHRGCVFASSDQVMSYYRIHLQNNELNFKINDDAYLRQSLRLYIEPFERWI